MKQSKPKKYFYWKWAVGAMQILYMLQKIDREIETAFLKPDADRTNADTSYIERLLISRQEIIAQSEMHENRPRRSPTVFDFWMITLYRWSQGIPKGMPLKLTVDDVK